MFFFHEHVKTLVLPGIESHTAILDVLTPRYRTHMCVQGRNEFAIHIISRDSSYLTWEEAFLCLRLDLLPDALRAKYCDLIIGAPRAAADAAASHVVP